jgi:hypothetical protein
MTLKRMQIKTIFCYSLLVLFLLHTTLFNGILFSQEKQNKKQYAGQEYSNPDSYTQPVNDGPYVFRQGNIALVITIRSSKVIKKGIEINELRSSYRVTVPAFKKTYIIPAISARVEPAKYRGVEKIFVISDIHGQFQWFKSLLLNNKIVDKKMRWRWGKGHLVILGDVFDRGEYVTEALWAIHQLEQQARAKGGRVHYLLGNHEVITLRGNQEYLHPKYRQVTEKILNTNISVLFGPDSILGQWVRTRNTIIQINDILFVHGGIHPQIAAMNLSIDDINRSIRDNLASSTETIEADETLAFLFDKNGPLLYRGYFEDSEEYHKPKPERIDQVLTHFGVKYVISGHTPQDHITPVFAGKIIGVDSGMQYGDRGEALLWNQGKFYRASVKGKLTPLFK